MPGQDCFFMAKEKSENNNKCVFWLINLTVWRGDNVLVIVNLQRWVRPISREPFQQTLIFLSFPPWFFLICIQTWNLSKILHRRIFRKKILHRQFHLILTVLVRKNTKNEWKWINLHRWQKFYTDATYKFHLWRGTLQFR